MIVAHCLRCKKKVEMVEVLERKGGRHNRFVYIGRCGECGGKVASIRQERNDNLVL